jgi:hypothetical protein
MSCSITVDAVRERRKTVTRRHVDTWTNLQPGDRLTLIEKGMGLPKGAKQVVLAEVEIVDVRVEAIGFAADREEVYLEGLPEMGPDEFVTMWLTAHGYRDRVWSSWRGDTPCRRIEWRYVS